MKYTILKTLNINGENYTHVINPETDATYLLDVEGDKVYTVSSDGYMFDCTEDERFIGSFRMESANDFKWFFDRRNGSRARHDSTDLIYTEQQVFKELFTQK
jgi:hypothetical protein